MLRSNDAIYQSLHLLVIPWFLHLLHHHLHGLINLPWTIYEPIKTMREEKKGFAGTVEPSSAWERWEACWSWWRRPLHFQLIALNLQHLVKLQMFSYAQYVSWHITACLSYSSEQKSKENLFIIWLISWEFSCIYLYASQKRHISFSKECFF